MGQPLLGRRFELPHGKCMDVLMQVSMWVFVAYFLCGDIFSWVGPVVAMACHSFSSLVSIMARFDMSPFVSFMQCHRHILSVQDMHPRAFSQFLWCVCAEIKKIGAQIGKCICYFFMCDGTAHLGRWHCSPKSIMWLVSKGFETLHTFEVIHAISSWLISVFCLGSPRVVLDAGSLFVHIDCSIELSDCSFW